MYRTYSPGEINQVAVVPSSSSPPSYQGSPTEDFASSPPAKRVCLDQLPASAFSFESFVGFSAPNPSPSSSSSALDLDFGAAFTAADFQQHGSGFEALQQQQCEDSKPVDLASYLQQQPSASANAAMQQQPQQQRRQQQMRSSMDLAAAGLGKEEYTIFVHQQPEEYYRARYETEGIRGPLKGRENNHPSVRIMGPLTYSGSVHVSLVHEDGSKHTSCFLDETKDRQKALTKKIDPQSNMIVEFEDLRIRRETKTKNYNKEGGRKADKTKSVRNDKTACLCFKATLQLAPDREIELKVLSKPIQLCAPPEGAELEWLIPEYGHTSGEEKIVIKGTKMTCPRVTFTVMLPDSQVVELTGQVDKEQSHQNVLVVKTPPLPDNNRNYQGPTLKAEVRVSSGRAGTCSAPLPFYYIPNGVCHTCRQSLPPAPLSIPVQPTPPFMAPYLSLAQCGPGISFAGCSGSPSHQQQQCGGMLHLQSYQEPHVTYPPRHCQEQMTSTLSHPPSLSNASTPSPLFDSPTPAATATGPTHCTQSPNISPTSSPGPVNNTGNYWSLTVAPPSALASGGPISITQHQDLSAILQTDLQNVSTSTTMALVTSPGSEPVYSAVPSPDTTYMTYLEDPNTPYQQFTT